MRLVLIVASCLASCRGAHVAADLHTHGAKRGLDDSSDRSDDSNSDSEAWGIETTQRLPRSEFIKMGGLIATKKAIDFSWRHSLSAVYVNNDGDIVAGGLNYPEGEMDGARYGGPYSFQERNPKIGSGMTPTTVERGPTVARSAVNVHLNAGVGAAFAHCYSIEVDDNVKRTPFRVCNNFEVQAISAVVQVPLGREVLSLSSSDGDDYDTGVFLSYYELYGGFMNNSSPSPNGEFVMQVYEGPEEEYDFDEQSDDLVAYCCSGEYLQAAGEGADR